MGLNPLENTGWIEVDGQFSNYLENKRKLYEQNPARVYAALDESADARRELCNRLLDHLLQHIPQHYQLDADDTLTCHGLASTKASELDLWQASLWVQEDLCLMQKMGSQYHLTAASLCAPSEWLLADKIGRPIADIHAPVPGLNSRLGKQIDHIFDKLSPLRPYQRFNWSIKDTSALALFPDQPTESDNELYLRVERQTLSRLPRSDAIAFTIRVYIYPLQMLTASPGALSALLDAVHGLSAAEVRYKSMDRLYPRLRQFCRQHS